jgi:predicted ATPase
LYEPSRAESYRVIYPFFASEPVLGLLPFAALGLCCMGYPDQALARLALNSARDLPDVYSRTTWLIVRALLHQLCGANETALSSAEEAIGLATEQGFQELLVGPSAIRVRLLVELSRTDEGIAQLNETTISLRAVGAGVPQSAFWGYLAEAYLKLARLTAGLEAVTTGLAVSERTGEHWYDAELFRIRGELLLKLSPDAEPNSQDQSENCFRQAIEIAQRQQAKWWELRATMSLARFLEKQNRRDEARAVLAGIYNWFTEGFDTADLKDAKALLDELTP